MSHSFFERARFEKVEIEGNLVFSTIRGSYIGICSQNGVMLADSGLCKNRELVCLYTDNIWICECGDVQENGTFDNFIQSLGNAKIECCGDSMVYDSPGIGCLKAGWDGPVTVNGEPIKMRGLQTIESEWVNGKFGDPHFQITYKGTVEDIWFV